MWRDADASDGLIRHGIGPPHRARLVAGAGGSVGRRSARLGGRRPRHRGHSGCRHDLAPCSRAGRRAIFVAVDATHAWALKAQGSRSSRPTASIGTARRTGAPALGVLPDRSHGFAIERLYIMRTDDGAARGPLPAAEKLGSRSAFRRAHRLGRTPGAPSGRRTTQVRIGAKGAVLRGGKTSLTSELACRGSAVWVVLHDGAGGRRARATQSSARSMQGRPGSLCTGSSCGPDPGDSTRTRDRSQYFPAVEACSRGAAPHAGAAA